MRRLHSLLSDSLGYVLADVAAGVVALAAAVWGVVVWVLAVLVWVLALAVLGEWGYTGLFRRDDPPA